MPDAYRKLVVERPNEEPQEVPWDRGAVRRFKFDEDEVKSLEDGEIVWRGPVAFSLEEEEDA